MTTQTGLPRVRLQRADPRRPHRLPDRPPRRRLRQTTNGYGRHFITLTIPVSCVIVEDDPTGPVNPANPFVTLDH